MLGSPEQVAQVYEQAGELLKIVLGWKVTLAGRARAVVLERCVARTVASRKCSVVARGASGTGRR